jgi:hypothetical protein
MAIGKTGYPKLVKRKGKPQMVQEISGIAGTVKTVRGKRRLIKPTEKNY